MTNIDSPVSKAERKLRGLISTIALVLMILIWLAVDPDAGFLTDLPFGAKLVMIFATLAKFIPYALAIHVARKVIFDYVKLEFYFKKANDTPEGCGMAIIGMGLFAIAFAIALFAATASW